MFPLYIFIFLVQVVVDVDPSCVAYREGLLERRGDGESTNKYGLRCVLISQTNNNQNI